MSRASRIISPMNLGCRLDRFDLVVNGTVVHEVPGALKHSRD